MRSHHTVVFLYLTGAMGSSLAAQPMPSEADRAAEGARLAEANRLAAEASAAYAKGDFAGCAELHVKAYEAGATVPSVPYNAACCFAKANRANDAFKYLDHSVRRGWSDLEHIKLDPDLESLRRDARWADLLKRVEVNQEAFQRSMSHPKLHNELMRRRREDQAARMANPPNVADMMRIDADNTKWIKQVVTQHGWPGKSMVGPEGAQAAWLLVQHADNDRAFQRQCLELLTEAHKKGEATGSDVAYLMDRVLVGEGKPQVYGTQFHTVDGKLQPFPIENEAEVDKRRAEVGLSPLAEYAKQMRSMEQP